MDIECGECVVENQNARPGQNRPGQRQPLTLAAGQAQPLLTDAGLQTEGQFVDELRSGDLDGAFHFGGGDGIIEGTAQAEILGDRHREQDRVLERDGHLLPQRIQR